MNVQLQQSLQQREYLDKFLCKILTRLYPNLKYKPIKKDGINGIFIDNDRSLLFKSTIREDKHNWYMLDKFYYDKIYDKLISRGFQVSYINYIKLSENKYEVIIFSLSKRVQDILDNGWKTQDFNETTIISREEDNKLEKQYYKLYFKEDYDIKTTIEFSTTSNGINLF